MPAVKETEGGKAVTPDALDMIASNWEAPFVARDQETLDRFSGGLLNARSLANADCKGEGPEGRIRIGRKVAYPTDALIEWMRRRRTL